MSDLELLERARARLTELRDASTPGPWTYQELVLGLRNATVMGHGHEHVGYVEAVGQFKDGHLVTALHRTIDAQLAMLKAQIAYAQWDPSLKPSAIDEPGYFADALVLARAILGEAE